MPKKVGIFLITVVLMIMGTNQPIRADTDNSVVSKATISFDGTYIPPKPDDSIPDGKTASATKDKKRVLPSTGETSKFNWLLLGLIGIGISIILNVKKIKKQKN